MAESCFMDIIMTKNMIFILLCIYTAYLFHSTI